MKKFNVIDAVLIALVVIALAGGGFMYFKSIGVKKVAGEQTTVVFDVECAELHQEAAEQFKSGIGSPLIYGNAKSDRGTMRSVKIEPMKKLQKDTITGEYKWVTYADRYTATVTVEAKVNQTATEFRQDKEYVRIGATMPVRGKGFAANGFIVNLEEVNK